MLRGVHDVENVLGDGAFWTAVVLGGLGTALVWARLRGGRVEPGVAVVAVVATVVALRVEHRLPAGLVVGVLLLLGGEWVFRDATWPARLLALVPGAVVLGAVLSPGWPFWMQVLVTVVTVLGGVLVDAGDRAAPRWVPLLLAIGACGVYVCVPDTEAPKALLGAVLATALIGLAVEVVPTLGSAALTGVFAWVVAFGGFGRPGSVVGGMACLGVVVLVPALRRLARSRDGVIALIVVQCALVAFVARVAGLEQDAAPALLLSASAFVAAGVVLVVVARLTARRRAPGTRPRAE